MNCRSPFDSFRQFAITLIFCVAIALFLELVDLLGSFLSHLIVSISIGLIIHLLIQLSLWLLSEQKPFIQLFAVILMIFIGTYLGLHLGLYISISMYNSMTTADINRIILKALPFALLFGGIISWFFYARDRLIEVQSQAKVEELKRIAQEKELIQAQLKLLQAQIEPHFLFNTLANVHSLIATQPELAATMLENLNRYLRESLDHSRSASSFLSKELELLKAYLDIQRVRMGKRLHYCFDVPDNVAALPFPPMLLQPLIENAVKHGLEPKISGGHISVYARLNDGMIEFEVEDDGVGLGKESSSGIGLHNIRERLQALFGEQASLYINTTETGGVLARLSIPTHCSQGRIDEF